MAKWFIASEEQNKIYNDWLAERPACVREMAEKYSLRPDTLYQMKTTGQRVTIVALGEDNTVRVDILKDFNMFPFAEIQECQVFGIDPADLVECDYPGRDDVMPGHWHPPLDGAAGQTLDNVVPEPAPPTQNGIYEMSVHPGPWSTAGFEPARPLKHRVRYRKGKPPLYWSTNGRRASSVRDLRPNPLLQYPGVKPALDYLKGMDFEDFRKKTFEAIGLKSEDMIEPKGEEMRRLAEVFVEANRNPSAEKLEKLYQTLTIKMNNSL